MSVTDDGTKVEKAEHVKPSVATNDSIEISAPKNVVALDFGALDIEWPDPKQRVLSPHSCNTGPYGGER